MQMANFKTSIFFLGVFQVLIYFSVARKHKHFILEGDLTLSQNQWNVFHTDSGALRGRQLKDKSFAWQGGVVPYKFSPKVEMEQKKTILQAMQHIESLSCVRYREALKSDTDFVVITNEDVNSCFSTLGMEKAEEKVINLSATACSELPTIIHELLHTLGFLHEHIAPDRDEYVKISWENIDPKEAHNFDKYTESINFGMKYDYKSVMHYAEDAFSINGKPTIVSITDEKVPDKPNNLSKGDILRLNKYYNCVEELKRL